MFDYSVFFKENAGTDNLNKYIRPYFDSYKSLLQQNKWSASYIDSPTILNNSNVVTGECTLIDVKNSSFTDNYIATSIKITNAKFKTDVGSLCNICTNKTAPINMTYLPTSVQQWNKIAECNVKSVEERIVSIPAGNVITPNNGFTIKSSNIYKDTYNSRVWCNGCDEYVRSKTMSEKIIRGTTPSYILDFSGIDDFDVKDLTSISMILMQRGIKKDLSEGCIVDTANNCIYYHFSEEDTFALVFGFPVTIETTVVVSGEVIRVGLNCYKVEKTLRSANMLGGR